jgi:hypothetical protein
MLIIFWFSIPEDGQLRPKHVANIIYSQLYQYIPIAKRDVKVKLSRYTPWRHIGGEEV